MISLEMHSNLKKCNMRRRFAEIIARNCELDLFM